jgi:hypothetical protein
VRAVVAVALPVLLGAVVATSAVASPPRSMNDVDIDVKGGDVRKVTKCVNRASARAKSELRKGTTSAEQENYCDNVTDVFGASVELYDVNIKIKQRSDNRKSSENSVDLSVRGGDTTVITSCVNVAKGIATTEQLNDCANDGIVQGASVVLEEVTIDISQG